jgi:hypothetical protein
MRDHKYYIIKRGINGKLLDIIGEDKKIEVQKIINEHLSLGYQITVVLRAVMLTADNLYEERAYLGLPQI